MFEIATQSREQRQRAPRRPEAPTQVTPDIGRSAEIWVALPDALGFLDPQSGKYGIFQRATKPTAGTSAAPEVPEDLLKEFKLKPESLAAFTHGELGTVLVDLQTSRVFQFDSSGVLRCRHLPAALGPFVCTLPANIRVEIVTPTDSGGRTVHTQNITPADIVRTAASSASNPNGSQPIEGSQRTAALTLILMAAGFAGIYALTHQTGNRAPTPASSPQVTSPQQSPTTEPSPVPPVEEAGPPALQGQHPAAPSDAARLDDTAQMNPVAPSTSPAPAPEAPTNDSAASVPSAIDPVDSGTQVAPENDASNIPRVPTPSDTPAPVPTAPENPPMVATPSATAPTEVGAEETATTSPPEQLTDRTAPAPDIAHEAAPAAQANQLPAQTEHPATHEPAHETQITIPENPVPENSAPEIPRQPEPHGLSVSIPAELLSILSDLNVTEGADGEEQSAQGTLVAPADSQSLSVPLSEESLRWLDATDEPPPAPPDQQTSLDRAGAQSGASSVGVALSEWSLAVLEGTTLPEGPTVASSGEALAQAEPAPAENQSQAQTSSPRPLSNPVRGQPALPRDRSQTTSILAAPR